MKKSSAPAEDAIACRLRDVGLKATRPRMLILGLLKELGGHQSADQIVALLEQQGTPLQRGSVYGVIEALVARGLVMTADAGPGRALYESNEKWHHHFVCYACCQVFDVPCIIGSKPCLLPDEFNGEVEEAQVIFRGRCAACVQSNRRAE